jgi:nicotinamidase-related amidase
VATLTDDADSVLVVIDVQPAFLDKLAPPDADAVVDRIRWLVKLAGFLDVPVVVTEEQPERNGATAQPIDAVVPSATICHTKPAFGLAACPPIMADLERHGRRTAVLCGLETDVCVAQSAIGLKDAGWNVVVLEDAVASPGSAHAQGLARLCGVGVQLAGVKALAYEWLRTVERTDLAEGFLRGDAPIGIVL